jgi:hypothetical protein
MFPGSGSKDPESVKAYVSNQRRHHSQGATHERLERTQTVEIGLARVLGLKRALTQHPPVDGPTKPDGLHRARRPNFATFRVYSATRGGSPLSLAHMNVTSTSRSFPKQITIFAPTAHRPFPSAISPSLLATPSKPWDGIPRKRGNDSANSRCYRTRPRMRHCRVPTHEPEAQVLMLRYLHFAPTGQPHYSRGQRPRTNEAKYMSLALKGRHRSGGRHVSCGPVAPIQGEMRKAQHQKAQAREHVVTLAYAWVSVSTDRAGYDPASARKTPRTALAVRNPIPSFQRAALHQTALRNHCPGTPVRSRDSRRLLA